MNRLAWCSLLTFGAVALRAMCHTSAADVKPRSSEEGFVSLFDGTSLTGWHISAKTGHSRKSGNKFGGRWVAEQGAITWFA